ncbi:28S ribosomal protein S21, mitochondrial-like [Carcharodon carcharias]|uniref:28S ribosomal protein S21, mitochondrial-like n=1 Tax=Carcharodon carcharias TaxID=13397 RepID=UPI001B7E2AE9|nr:28S ribosomal protein S21, mitochondrial-like [Carcharodon carcharias]
MAAHTCFVSRTVMVQGGNVEMVFQALTRILTTDRIIEEAKSKGYYEKPCRKGIYKHYENCRRIYNNEMARKLAFLVRKNRQDP